MKNNCELNPAQKETLKDIKSAISNLVTDHDIALNARSDNNGELSYTYEPGFANAIGIFGERGSGKSTLLIELYKRSIRNDCHEPGEFITLLESLYFIQPIDCSTLAQTNIPSAVVLLHIKRSIKKELDNNNFRNEAKIKVLLDKLEPLIGWCTRIGKDYRKLSLELSTIPSDYDFYQQKGIEERLDLKRKLSYWLKDASDILNKTSFVILLDDFDLCPVTQVHGWFNALLDELQQAGLVFVVTADFHRLEHLSWDRKTQFDDKTGRALLNKIFPPKHCMLIPEWKTEEILNFSLPQRNQDKTIEKQPQGESLKTLLSNLFNGKEKLSINVVSSLLPHSPRGIENLYEQLPTIDPEDDKYSSVMKFTSLLATCRNEPLLARILTERTTRPWSAHLKLNDKPLSPEQWGSLIVKAYQRPTWRLDNKEHLIPFNDLLSVNEPKSLNKSTSRQQAPLFHESAYTDPLRDAREADRGLWVELLLNLDLYSSIRFRVSFLTLAKPLVERLNEACFHVPFPRWEIRAFFTDNESTLTKATLCWLKTSDNGQIHIGWQPLFSSLRGERDPLVTKLLNQLLVDTTRLKGDLPSESNLELLPNRLWSLFVLVDALERCPWQAFSKFLNWLVVTYIALAAAFVRTAYFYTLNKSGFFKKNSRFSKCLVI